MNAQEWHVPWPPNFFFEPAAASAAEQLDATVLQDAVEEEFHQSLEPHREGMTLRQRHVDVQSRILGAESSDGSKVVKASCCIVNSRGFALEA